MTLGPRNGPKFAALATLVVVLVAAYESAYLAEGSSGTGIRCTITDPADVNRTDIFMQLYTCSSWTDGPGCTMKLWPQTDAIRRAFVDHVEFDWIFPVPREEFFFYGICQLCLIDWSDQWAEEHPELQQCNTSAPMLAGTTIGTPLPEPDLLIGLLSAGAFLALLYWYGSRLLK